MREGCRYACGTPRAARAGRAASPGRSRRSGIRSGTRSRLGGFGGHDHSQSEGRWWKVRAAGFIGAHATAELLRRGRAVRVLDNCSTGKRATHA